MKLIIDYGNTLAKIALFRGDSLVDYKVMETLTINDIKLFTSQQDRSEPVRYCILSSVRTIPGKIISYLNTTYKLFELDQNIRLPISIKYKTPETLGNDRIAIAVGAVCQFPNEDMLVIDAGTCITYDFINRDKEYLGGAISPGINMRFKALNTFTDKLPLVTNMSEAGLIGDTTDDSIRSGVLNGVLEEVNGIIGRYKEVYPSIKVIFTGGDLKYFDKNLKNNIFANSNLVLEGLNMILNFNVED